MNSYHKMNISDGNEALRQRVTEQLKTYWIELKKERIFPDEADVDLESIASIWESCFLVKYEPSLTKGFSYVYLGSELVAAYGDDVNDRETCERLVFPSSDPILHKFDEVRTQKKYIEHEGEFVNTKGLNIRYRSIMLPLGVRGTDEVGFIIGGMRWKAYL
jgi:hypothetical protein